MKYIRRFLSFVASRLVILSVVVALLILAFYLAMNTANIYILLNDGMTARASVILTRERRRADQLFHQRFSAERRDAQHRPERRFALY